MGNTPHNDKLNQTTTLLAYVEGGDHAFISCDNRVRREQIVKKLQEYVSHDSVERIDCDGIASISEFSDQLASHLEKLVSTLGLRHRLRYRFRNRQFGISKDLDEAMKSFRESERQGHLILNNIDAVIELQTGMEVEGPLRSIMQQKHDIAVVLSGTSRVIDKLVGDSHRPFYLSFRVFRL